MPIELKLLGFAVIIGLVQIILQATTTTAAKGLSWNAGPRDDDGDDVPPLAARLQRALANFLETFPLFAAATLAVVVAGKTNEATHMGALAYVIGRAVFVPLYALGVPYVRSLSWVLATGGIVAIVIALLQ